MVYAGQAPEGLKVFDHEDIDLLFTERVSRDVSRLKEPKAGDRQNIGALLTHLTALSEEGDSFRATRLLGQLSEELPSTSEAVHELVAEHQVRDRSGLVAGYDNAVGMIWRTTADK